MTKIPSIKTYSNNGLKQAWLKFYDAVCLVLSKLHYKILSSLIDLENSREYDPPDLFFHNRKMMTSNSYKISYYIKRVLYSIRFSFMNFLADVLVTIFVFMILFMMMFITGFFGYWAMMFLVF